MSDIPPELPFNLGNFFLVETSLKYVRDYLEAANVALTISLDYATIKEWYYLVKEQEKFPEDEQLQDNAKTDDEGGECFLIEGYERVKGDLGFASFSLGKRGYYSLGMGINS